MSHSPKPEEFNIVKHSYDCADEMVENSIVALGHQDATIHLQLVAIRLLAVLSASEMHDTCNSFDQCMERVMRVLRKESRHVLQEILEGRRSDVKT